MNLLIPNYKGWTEIYHLRKNIFKLTSKLNNNDNFNVILFLWVAQRVRLVGVIDLSRSTKLQWFQSYKPDCYYLLLLLRSLC